MIDALLQAFLWGALGASALLAGALLAYVTTPSRRFIAVIMALGSGVLFGSVSFELVENALEKASPATVGLVTLADALTFTTNN